ncbi:hypothetical protein PFWH6_1197 [Pseudomonas fluorescens WH6]|nr:hypothetical protein PFWH6_1197 [Pseudomonas fluorescens WH6]
MAELTSQPTTIQSLYAMYSDNLLHVNRRYQRKLVWTLEEKQKLIESILKKYPIPAILIAEREESPGTYEIIDGLQRLHAIMSFIETSFSDTRGSMFSLEHFPSAKRRADEGAFTPNESELHLTQREVGTILDYPFAMSVMRGATEDEINDVFGRINTYGHRLSDQERRQAGIQNSFSELVRSIACTLRGDESHEILPLNLMPSISIDLPKTKHGYLVQADEVFWVEHGILRSTELRDSIDEQCIADIAACIVGGQLIERSKEALDAIYTFDSPESDRILAALEVYGAERLSDEMKYCIAQILEVCASGNPEKPEKLRNIIFKTKSTNPFPAAFAVVLIAFHEIIVKDNMIITDHNGIREAIFDLTERIGKGQGATSAAQRRKNINSVKGLISEFFTPAQPAPPIYGNHAIADIDSLLRRSEIEQSDFEFKQGILSLSNDRKIDPGILQKIHETLCAIANNGPQRAGKLIIGVSDKPADTERVAKLDKVSAKKVGKRDVVGINREARILNISTEDYFIKIKESIKHADLSEPLKTSVLSHIDYNPYFGLGIIVITIPPQQDVSYYNEHLYWRTGDSTTEAKTAKEVAAVAKRF